jgi:chorismate mutase
MSPDIRVRAVRGAIGIDANEGELIRRGVVELVEAIEEKNRIVTDSYVSIVFSQTHDLTALNPATALRSRGYESVPLFCTQEPDYHGSVPRIIRVLVTWYAPDGFMPVPVYLNGAERLRSDLFEA